MDWKRALRSLKFAVAFVGIVGALVGGMFMIIGGAASASAIIAIAGAALFILGIAAVHYIS